MFRECSGWIITVKPFSKIANKHAFYTKFSAHIIEFYEITIDIMQGELGDIPVDQPLIVVPNHPYGILDGLVKWSILARSGANVKLL